MLILIPIKEKKQKKKKMILKRIYLNYLTTRCMENL